jgi:hypothetical protein
VTDLRSAEQRKTDVLATLSRNGDAWLATASPSGKPHMIAVAFWWDGDLLVIATGHQSRTARNLDATSAARLATGSPDDAIMIDASVVDSVPARDADEALVDGFSGAVGWNPNEEAGDWRFYRLRPVQVQAYRGYGELEGRVIMRRSRWLT